MVEQVPFEAVGDFGAMNVMKRAFREIPAAVLARGNGKEIGKFVATAAAEAGLWRGITQPPQTFVQETRAEAAGVQAPTTREEKLAKAGYETGLAVSQGVALGGAGAGIGVASLRGQTAARDAKFVQALKTAIAQKRAEEQTPYAQGGAIPSVTGTTGQVYWTLPWSRRAMPRQPSDIGWDVASQPTMITKAMEADLKHQGFTDDQINKMTPVDAWKHIQAAATKAAPPDANIPQRFNALPEDARARVQRVPVMHWDQAIKNEEANQAAAASSGTGPITPPAPGPDVEGPTTNAELEKMKQDYLGGPAPASALARSLGARSPEEEKQILTNDVFPHIIKLQKSVQALGADFVIDHGLKRDAQGNLLTNPKDFISNSGVVRWDDSSGKLKAKLIINPGPTPRPDHSIATRPRRGDQDRGRGGTLAPGGRNVLG